MSDNGVGISLITSSASTVVRNVARGNGSNYSNVAQPTTSSLTLGTVSPWANVSD